jgi:DNA-binding XRE family transcriptional regulator
MIRNVNQVIAVSRERQKKTGAGYKESKDKVEGLRELREVAGKAQTDVASVLKIKQPSVSKIEKQADMYLSTLRSYVQAIGGELDLVVRLPKRPALWLQYLSNAFKPDPRKASRRAVTTPNQRTRGR